MGMAMGPQRLSPWVLLRGPMFPQVSMGSLVPSPCDPMAPTLGYPWHPPWDLRGTHQGIPTTPTLGCPNGTPLESMVTPRGPVYSWQHQS